MREWLGRGSGNLVTHLIAVAVPAWPGGAAGGLHAVVALGAAGAAAVGTAAKPGGNVQDVGGLECSLLSLLSLLI